MAIKVLMKNLLIILLISTSFDLSSQNIEINEYPALKTAMETSLYKDDVNWDEITRQYVKLAKESKGSFTHYE
jgi:hypothetical protein